MAIKTIDGGVTAAKGYKAAGLRAGIKAGKTNKDMAMIYSEVPAVCAGTFTKNLVKAAPVQWDSNVVYNEKQAQAVVINSGIANACTGEPGYEDCKKTAEAAAKKLGISPNTVLVASTGVIGFRLPMDKITSGVELLGDALSDSREAARLASEAILTTDTHKKEIAVQFEIDGTTVTMGAMCKGSGMIHPNMGTMLGFITCDADIDYEVMLSALREAVDVTFNMVSVDGDTSTNDSVLLLANGKAGNTKITGEGAALDTFKEALLTVTTYLAKQIAGDGEGATRLFEARVTGAPDYETAKILAKSIITSNLTKCAIYGKDANWGRILCAMGYSGAQFDPLKVDITIKSEKGSIKLVENGMGTSFSEEKALEILEPDTIIAECDIKSGTESAVAWGCDLTYDYVKINADYRS
jgi:glutamate N-acetyltransferase/amino-acid N-acetyltransferase